MRPNFMPNTGRFGAAIRTPAPVLPDAEPAYAAGDTVMHPAEGVCTITELRPMEFSGAQPRLYYILKPASEKTSSTVYLPVSRGNTVLRRLLSEKDIHSLIAKSSQYTGLWITDSKQRKEAFAKILCEGNYAKVIRMIQEIHKESAKREAEGKKPCASDEAIRTEAERLLHQEFSYVLRMSVEETAAFIRRKLGE